MAHIDMSYIPASYDVLHAGTPPARLARGPAPVLDTGAFTNVHLVGVSDFPERSFHGVPIDGTNYVSTLIDCGEAGLILVDTVKAPFVDELIANIIKVAGPDAMDRLKYVVSLHSEPDHSGGLSALTARCPETTLVANASCKRALCKFYPALCAMDPARWLLAKPSTKLDLGQFHLSFVPMPLLHWPDNMLALVAHDDEEKMVALTSDGLGSHLPSHHRFADTYLAAGGSRDFLLEEVIKYHASIVGPYLTGPLRGFLDKKFDPIANKIAAIVPAHGLCYRTPEDIAWVRGGAELLAAGHKAKGKVVILFCSMYGSSKTLAETIDCELAARGLHPVLINSETSSKMDWARHGWDAEAVVVVSPTLNNRAYPSIVAALSYLDGLTFLKNMPVWISGTYGWAAKEMPAHVKETVERGGAIVKNASNPLMVMWKGDAADLDKTADLAQAVAEELAME